MATQTYQEQLEACQTAIQRILEGGQEVVFEGRRVTYADLDALSRRESMLRRLADREAGTGGGIRYGVPV